MARRKHQSKKKRPDILWRNVTVSDVRLSLSLRTEHEKGAEPEFDSTVFVEVSGTLDEPIRGVREIETTLYPTDNPKPGTTPIPWVGLVHGIKPVIRPALFISHREFDRVWGLALSKSLKHAQILMTEPRYNRAYVIHFTVSTHPEEQSITS